MSPKTVLIATSLVGCLGLAGCGRSKKDTADSGAERVPPDAAQPVAESPAPVEPGSAVGRAQAAPTLVPDAVAGQAIAGVVDPNLTVQLRLFVQQKGRLPDSFAEFAGARLDSVPRSPARLGLCDRRRDPRSQNRAETLRLDGCPSPRRS